MYVLNVMFWLFRCLEYLCRYGSPAGMNVRDNSYKTPLLAAVQAKLPGHVQRLLMAKVNMSYYVEYRGWDLSKYEMEPINLVW